MASASTAKPQTGHSGTKRMSCVDGLRPEPRGCAILEVQLAGDSVSLARWPRAPGCRKEAKAHLLQLAVLKTDDPKKNEDGRLPAIQHLEQVAFGGSAHSTGDPSNVFTRPSSTCHRMLCNKVDIIAVQSSTGPGLAQGAAIHY